MHSLRFKVIAFTLFLSFLVSPTALAWEVNSTNSSSGITATATTFWIEGYGPATLKDVATVPTVEGSSWAILQVFCVKKSPFVSIQLLRAGSDNRSISEEWTDKVDDPGFLNLVFDGKLKKRFRTSSFAEDRYTFLKAEGAKVFNEIVKRKSLNASVRPSYSSNPVKVSFNISGFIKHKARFRSAGCKFA